MTVQIAPLSAQKRLIAVWFVGSIAILLIMIARMQGQDAFACDPSDKSCDPTAPWKWWGAAVTPTLMVMVGAIVATAVRQKKSNLLTIDRFWYRLALWLSVVYLLVVLLPVLTRNTDPASALTNARWIPVLQTIVAAAVGRFFLKPKEAKRDASSQKSESTGRRRHPEQ